MPQLGSGPVLELVNAATPFYFIFLTGLLFAKYHVLHDDNEVVLKVLNGFAYRIGIPFLVVRVILDADMTPEMWYFVLMYCVYATVCGVVALAIAFSRFASQIPLPFAPLDRDSPLRIGLILYTLLAFPNTFILGSPVFEPIFPGQGNLYMLAILFPQIVIQTPLMTAWAEFILEREEARAEREAHPNPKSTTPIDGQPPSTSSINPIYSTNSHTNLCALEPHDMEEAHSDPSPLPPDGGKTLHVADTSTPLGPTLRTSTRTRRTLIRILKSPPAQASILGMILLVLFQYVPTPVILINTLNHGGNTVLGIALFIIGMYLHQLLPVFSLRTAVSTYCIRTFGGGLLCYVACLVTGLHGVDLQLGVLQSVLPSAVAGFLLLMEFNIGREIITMSILTSTLLVLPTLLVTAKMLGL
mmetsp:Transcript_17857/g.30009  ORF Transcript_17857/g.30009 Transcript_17857/m.30009 type:complete len:414 (+) Transcript_17857:163-1404(+)|eukprot:CAMPEP_0198208290 /NCGR_PEP_ID=MMETSP1445-20131203/11669_1 /TAXON_ID=36898 /ORGANISM="Pyramimonas sp., Strain CCMP2087" /LENGTH=413 /DNA_ID=CAMNT_0043881633 /DNA_START=123 /DNA_END=1364 /DNA_ORIENTATION=+